MNETELIAILAAIIHAGADHNEGKAGYSPAAAVSLARHIYREAGRAVMEAKQGEV